MIDLLIIVVMSNCLEMDHYWYAGLAESIEDYYGLETGSFCMQQYNDLPHKYAKFHVYVFIDTKAPIDLKGNWGWTQYGKNTAYVQWQPSYDKLNSWIITHEMMHMQLFIVYQDRDIVEHKLLHSFQPESKADYYYYGKDWFIGYILYSTQ